MNKRILVILILNLILFEFICLGVSSLVCLLLNNYSIITILVVHLGSIVSYLVYIYMVKFRIDKLIVKLGLDKNRVKTMITYMDNYDKINEFLSNQSMSDNSGHYFNPVRAYEDLFKFDKFSTFHGENNNSLMDFYKIAKIFSEENNLTIAWLITAGKLSIEDFKELKEINRAFNIYQEETTENILNILNTKYKNHLNRRPEQMYTHNVTKIGRIVATYNEDVYEKNIIEESLNEARKCLNKSFNLKRMIDRLDIELSHKYMLTNLYDGWLLMTILYMIDNKLEVNEELKESLDKIYTMAEKEELKEKEIEDTSKKAEEKAKDELWKNQSREFLNMIDSISKDI